MGEWWLTTMVLNGLHPDDATLAILLHISSPQGVRQSISDATWWAHAAIIRAYATGHNAHQVEAWYSNLLQLSPPSACQLSEGAESSMEDIIEALEHLTLHCI